MADIDADRNMIAELSRQIELSSLDRELELLPQTLRDPLVEHYILGYSARQIADRLELSTSAVEGRLRRGRRLLRHRLALRGTSLSIVVSGAAWLRDHPSTATAGDQWTGHMFEIATTDSSSLDSVLSADPYIAQLVNGELTMHLAPFLKPIALLTAAAVVTVSASLFALAPQFGGGGLHVSPSAGVPQGVTAGDESAASSTLTVQSKGQAQPIGAGAVTSPATASAGGRPTGKSTSFVRPEGPPPDWLQFGNEDNEAREEIRKRIRQTVAIDFSGLPLSQVLSTFASEAKVDIIVNYPDLDEVSVDPDTPITLTLHGKIPLCEALERVLGPFALTYVVQEQCITVTRQDGAADTIRYYDLAYLLPTSDAIADVIRTIEMTVTPGDWASLGGGESTIGVIGSMMVVSCKETAHRQIEKLLAQLAKMDPQNLRSSGMYQFPGQGMGGMGGGGMGGGGMGGMF
jgi:hypothetical protein